MTKVFLTKGWHSTVSFTDMDRWLRTHDISADEWEIVASPAVNNPYIGFAKETDALAFRLKFGL